MGGPVMASSCSWQLPAAHGGFPAPLVPSAHPGTGPGAFCTPGRALRSWWAGWSLHHSNAPISCPPSAFVLAPPFTCVVCPSALHTADVRDPRVSGEHHYLEEPPLTAPPVTLCHCGSGTLEFHVPFSLLLYGQWPLTGT